jgi:glycosyltransferase involved in cell wall biosynthesis
VKDTVVFIPAWNEERSLPGVLAEARRSLPDADLLVIDDGSTDGTAAVAREAGAAVVSFERNRGLRAGIAEGYRQALTRG